MLRVILSGWSEGGDAHGLRQAIQNATGIGSRAAGAHVVRIQKGETLILTLEAERLSAFLHQCLRLGVTTADMFVGPNVEEQ